MKTLIIIIVVIVVLGGGLYYYSVSQNAPDVTPGNLNGESGKTDNPPATGGATSNPPASTPEAQNPPAETPVSVKVFTVEGRKFSFTPSALTVKKGDKVKITFKNLDGFHDFVIDEFNVRTKQIPVGEETIEFVADKTGSFEFYCSVGNHRELGMKGTLTIE